MVNMTIGQQLRLMRLDRGWTLRRVANRVGITIGHLSALELGKNVPPIDTLRKICRAYGVDVKIIFEPKEERRTG